jgi:quercetin dioxygenase-like cupin family protein
MVVGIDRTTPERKPDMPYPQTISNGDGQRLTFVARRHDDRGEYLEVANQVDPGAGPPMHVHHLQEETLTVERGTLAYQRPGEPEQRAGTGETVTFPPGVAHRFWNAGEDELVCTGTVRPPDNLEYFLRKMYASTKRNGGGRPGIFDAAYLSHRYRTEFAMTDIPAPVRRLVLPLIAALGNALGRQKHFVNAPEPIRRARPA